MCDRDKSVVKSLTVVLLYLLVAAAYLLQAAKQTKAKSTICTSRWECQPVQFRAVPRDPVTSWSMYLCVKPGDTADPAQWAPFQFGLPISSS
jgi:hypothetical protein